MNITRTIKKNVEIYEEVIHNLCLLFIKLGIENDPILIYETFIYMYTNGYLSAGKKYSSGIPNQYIIPEEKDYIPLDIAGCILMSNYGVCRHTTDFLSHVYQNLDYDCSRLFTYLPNLKVTVLSAQNTLTKNEKQKYIDRAIKEIDLYGKEEKHLTIKYGKVKVCIDYTPSKPEGNHTMNIVAGKGNGRVHILDTKNFSIGEKNDNESIKVYQDGLSHIEFLINNLNFSSYYQTDYYKGLELLKLNTNIKKDLSAAATSSALCKNYIEHYIRFYLENNDKYRKATDNYNQLVKKLTPQNN